METIKIPDPNPKRVEGGYYETRCLLKAELQNGLLVLVTHFGLCIDEQENAVKTILENIRDEKCILMGDFNVTPDNELLSPIKAKMKEIVEKGYSATNKELSVLETLKLCLEATARGFKFGNIDSEKRIHEI